MHVVTIVAANFLPRAAVLARTHLQHNPDDQVTVLVVDAEPGEHAATDSFSVITPADLSLAAVEFERMALIYDVTAEAARDHTAPGLLPRGPQAHLPRPEPDVEVVARRHPARLHGACLARGKTSTPSTAPAGGAFVDRAKTCHNRDEGGRSRRNLPSRG